jgi:hypothetical protein
MRSVIRRELNVAFSKKAQPMWFRVAKWVFILGVTAALWRSPYLGWFLGGAVVVGLAIHLLWRWKTKEWTQPWGGWSDLEAGDR